MRNFWSKGWGNKTGPFDYLGNPIPLLGGEISKQDSYLWKDALKSDLPRMPRAVWRLRSDKNHQQEIDSSMTTHDSINLLMSFLKLEISEEL